MRELERRIVALERETKPHDDQTMVVYNLTAGSPPGAAWCWRDGKLCRQVSPPLQIAAKVTPGYMELLLP